MICDSLRETLEAVNFPSTIHVQTRHLYALAPVLTAFAAPKLRHKRLHPTIAASFIARYLINWLGPGGIYGWLHLDQIVGCNH